MRLSALVLWFGWCAVSHGAPVPPSVTPCCTPQPSVAYEQAMLWMQTPGMAKEAFPEKITEDERKAVEQACLDHDLWQVLDWAWPPDHSGFILWSHEAYWRKYYNSHNYPRLADHHIPPLFIAASQAKEAYDHYNWTWTHHQNLSEGAWWRWKVLDRLTVAADPKKPELLRRLALFEVGVIMNPADFALSRWPSPVPREHAWPASGLPKVSGFVPLK
jgi:hypothetical protein